MTLIKFVNLRKILNLNIGNNLNIVIYLSGNIAHSKDIRSMWTRGQIHFVVSRIL